MNNYDGWVIKSLYTRTPFLMPWSFNETRRGVIEWYEFSTSDDWKKERRKGRLKIVKVKLVEVEKEE